MALQECFSLPYFLWTSFKHTVTNSDGVITGRITQACDRCHFQLHCLIIASSSDDIKALSKQRESSLACEFLWFVLCIVPGLHQLTMCTLGMHRALCKVAHLTDNHILLVYTVHGALSKSLFCTMTYIQADPPVFIAFMYSVCTFQWVCVSYVSVVVWCLRELTVQMAHSSNRFAFPCAWHNFTHLDIWFRG